MRPPVFRALFEGELVVDNFAGGGGASTGIEAALRRPVDLAINHDPIAIAMHRANHPGTKHFCENIVDVDPREACAGRPVGLAWFSPDCFPAGTMILTKAGYRPVELIRVGEEVLTHRLQWRRVTRTMQATKPLVSLRGHGHPDLRVSAEHPFLARERADVWNNDLRRLERTLGERAWRRAGDLGRGFFWATPTAFPAAEPPAPPVYRERTFAVDERLMWLAGRYVADGWTRLTETRAELVITCGMHEVDGLRPLLDRWPREGERSGSGELAWHERATATAYQFATNCRGLVEWLRGEFGHGAAEKRIPGWALGMARPLRQALLDGYISGDGWRGILAERPVTECSTVSRALAFGVKALAASLGHSVCVYRQPNRSVIEGRKVDVKDSWHLRWRQEVDAAHRQTFREDGIEWAPVRERRDTGDVEDVYNLSVEEDESYVADGIIVHNCTHFSRAKGTKPRRKEIRGLAWVVIRWAKTVRPRVIVLENVEEFQTWGPLLENGQPDKGRAGETFRAWTGALSDLGYELEYRSLVAADYGTPTTRKRLFLIARRDRQPLVWPEATHHERGAPRWRPAAEVIDWSLPCPSIFGRKRPLAEKTMRRIAAGVRRYVLEAARPFVIPVTHAGNGTRVHGIDEPLRTVTAAHRGELALVAPTLVQTGYGEREGQRPRALDIQAPLGTVVAGGQKHGLVAALVTKHYGGVVGHDVRRTLGTVTSQDHHALTAAFLTKYYGTSTGADVCAPLPTVTAGGGRGGGHLAEVRAFLIKYYGGESSDSRQQSLLDPLHTVTTARRFGLVMVAGEPYQIVDIGMRMLQPHELFAAQGFPADYEIRPEYQGKPLTKTAQIALAGNSVCPPLAEHIVGANASDAREEALRA